MFLLRVLLPLHKARTLGMFQPQLAYCIVQFIEKDRSLASAIVRGASAAFFTSWCFVNCAGIRLLFVPAATAAGSSSDLPRLGLTPLGLMHFWPRTNSNKEVMLLCELEEIVDMMHPSDFADVHLVRRLL